MSDEEEVKAAAEAEDEEADVSAMLDLSKKKKKKKKKKDKESSGGGATATAANASDGAADTTLQQQLIQEQDAAQEVDDPDDQKADYSYEDLLDRVVDLLQANNPDLVQKKRTRIKPPQLQLRAIRELWIAIVMTTTTLRRLHQHQWCAK